MRKFFWGSAGILLATVSVDVAAQDTADKLAKRLSDPIASSISVPFQGKADFGGGPDGDGINLDVRLQPVTPFELNEDWKVISRTILPVSFATDIFPENEDGRGDATKSLFVSPETTGIEGFTWGAGPVIMVPKATNPATGSGKRGVGPTGLMLYQWDRWTVGVLVNQIWAVAGKVERADLSELFLLPFVAYALGDGQTVTGDLEAGYDGNAAQWAVPINLLYSRVFQMGEQPMSFQVGARKYVVTPPEGPDWGIRTSLAWLFPAG